MTPHQIDLLETTWRAVATLGAAAPRLFYERLFETDPTTKPLFAHVDMEAQGAKLLDALGCVVESAGQIDRITVFLEELGRRHAAYGVEDHHYDSVGAALLWTLEQGLGDAFTEEVREAWTLAYTHVATTMRTAAAVAPGDVARAPGAHTVHPGAAAAAG